MTDLDKIKKIYFIGIKGSGVIGLVEIFHKLGKDVTGSDIPDKFFTEETLHDLGVRYYVDFSEKNIEKEKPDLVIYSTAYSPENNIEMKYAKDQGIPNLSYPEVLGKLMENKFGIAVAGTHGKTTTTAMLALAMREAGADPTAVVGFKVTQIKSNVLVGKSQFFLIEADEYQNKFQFYNPMAVVLTSIDYDHPDFFPTFDVYKNTFKEFVKKIPQHGFLVVWGESVDTIEIAKEANCKIIVYGKLGGDIDSDLVSRIRTELEQAGKKDIEFVVTPKDFNLQIPGKHNLLNATAVLAVARQLKLDEDKIISALNNYRGASRRFERLGKYNGAEIIDDYAHHPEEIKATLQGAREIFPDKNIICVFHPHTFTRTKALLDDFSQSFTDCSQVVILDIYGSARENQGNVHAKDLVEKIQRFKQNSEYIATIDEAYENLKDKLDENDVVITMGAGDVNKLGERLLSTVNYEIRFKI